MQVLYNNQIRIQETPAKAKISYRSHPSVIKTNLILAYTNSSTD